MADKDHDKQMLEELKAWQHETANVLAQLDADEKTKATAPVLEFRTFQKSLGERIAVLEKEYKAKV